MSSGRSHWVAVTSMLTLIAYRFMVDTMLSPVSYLTRMDLCMFGSTVLVFTALLQGLVTSSLARGHREHQAFQVDVWCRIIFPAIFFGMFFIVFWSSYV